MWSRQPRRLTLSWPGLPPWNRQRAVWPRPQTPASRHDARRECAGIRRVSSAFAVPRRPSVSQPCRDTAAMRVRRIARRSGRVRLTGACGLWSGAVGARAVRLWSTSACGSHAGVCAPGDWVDMSVSSVSPGLFPAAHNERRCSGPGAGARGAAVVRFRKPCAIVRTGLEVNALRRISGPPRRWRQDDRKNHLMVWSRRQSRRACPRITVDQQF